MAALQRAVALAEMDGAAAPVAEDLDFDMTRPCQVFFEIYRGVAEGGPRFVKAVLGPMPFLRIVPTNGVHANNAASYLKAGAWAVGFVQALFDANDLDAGRFDQTELRAQKLLAACAG